MNILNKCARFNYSDEPRFFLKICRYVQSDINRSLCREQPVRQLAEIVRVVGAKKD